MSSESGVETITVSGDFITVDLLIWRRFQTRTPGLVERVLDMNRDLAGLGPILPIGTVVKIPIDAPDLRPSQRPVVRLWD